MKAERLNAEGKTVDIRPQSPEDSWVLGRKPRKSNRLDLEELMSACKDAASGPPSGNTTDPDWD